MLSWEPEPSSSPSSYTERKKGKKAKREKEEGKQECLNLRSVIEDFLLLCLSLFSRAGVNLLAGVLHKKKVKSKNTPNNFPPVPRHQVSLTLALELWKVKLMPKAVVAKFLPSA